MAYQPQYGYGQQPPYPYGSYTPPSNNRDALLAALQGNQYQYPTNPQMSRTPSGTAGAIGNIAAGTIAGTPAISKGIVGAIGGGYPAAGLGGAATMGIGLGTELASGYLKPKQQLETASPFANITDQYSRRHEGSGEGIAGGAVKWGGRGAEIGSVIPGIGTAVGAGIGALAGAIGGAFTKNAASAYSDFTQQDARDAITKLYAQDGQQPPTPAELDQILKGQGWQQGDRWVGEKGLYTSLANLDNNFKRQAVQQQIAGATPAAGARAIPIADRASVETGGIVGPAGSRGADTSASAAATIPANADTDGYAAPAYTAQTLGAVMPGWDATKFADPNHQTPKYVVGRMLSNIAPTTANMDQAVAEIAKAYPGAQRVGNGDVEIPGLGTIDILEAADAGGKAWRWDDGSGGSGGADQSAGGGTGAGYDASGDVSSSDMIAKIIARLQGLAGGTGNGVTSNRDALLNVMGA